MKHFCFLTGLYSRYDVLMFERQGKSLIKAGFKVTYVVCDNIHNEIIDGIEIISTGYIPKSRFDRFIHTRKILFNKAKEINADIYQISDPELISLCNKFKKLNKKIIFNMREYYPTLIKNKYYIPKIFRNLASNGYELLMKENLKKYDAVFVVTNWILDIIKNMWKIENAFLLTNYPIVDTNYRLSYEDYLKRGDVLFYEGTVYQTSRQENVFKALENLPQVKYLIAGVIDETYDAIQTLSYWSKVEFINGFKIDDLPRFFAKSSICNVFRDFEGMDGSLGVIKIFESMEAALPVLLADVPLYRKIVNKYYCGICVDPNNSKQIENAIRYLVENKKEAYEMGQNGRRAVIEEYNWENQAQNYIAVLNEL